MQLGDRQNLLQTSQAFKQSGIMRKWKARILIVDFKSRILRYLDIKHQSQKQIYLPQYNIREVAQESGKWSIALKVKPEFDVEPKLLLFGWEVQQEAKMWHGYLNGSFYVEELKRQENRKLEEWDAQKPTSERVYSDPVATVPTMHVKPSARMRTLINMLPPFLQSDIEEVLASVLENLQGFSDIEHLTLIRNQPNAQVYQDPSNPLHMKLIYFSEMMPQRIFDEFALPTSIKHWSPLIATFHMYPTKKDCAIIQTELDLNAGMNEVSLIKQSSMKDMDELPQMDEIKSPKSNILHQNLNQRLVKLVYTQKHVALDGLYCIIRKFTGMEKNHDQIEKSGLLNQFRVRRSVTLIQPTKKDNFNSQIIEEVQLDCEDKQAGEQILLMFLLNVENIDKFLLKSDQYLRKHTMDVVVKHINDPDRMQISFKVPEIEIHRITSEQHQNQSKDEYIKIQKMIKSGQHIIEAINNSSDQQILPGLNKQLQTTHEDGHFLYTKYYELEPKKGGLNYTNKTLISNQRKVIFDMIKRMGSNLFSGRSIMAVSLPIQIFESRSFLERMARAQGHAPLFLEPAAQKKDPIEQMKLFMAFQMSSFMMGIQQEKPFNPIIGETFQGRILGCPIYLEQTSHHPPISNFIFYGREYRLFGCFSPAVNMGTNSLSGEQHGHQSVLFSSTGLRFYYIAQPFTVYGITLGQRSVNCHKRAFCFQPELQLLGWIQFNPKDENASIFSSSSQKIDYFEGNIAKVSPDLIKKCLAAHKTNSGLNLKLKVQPKDVIETYVKITGRWTCFIEFDGVKYWNIQEHRPYVLELESNPLPSDCLYRLDLLLMKMKDMAGGQAMKEDMEVDQRKDKQMREKLKKK